ncbi:MAG TPA: hypothetical protein PLP01_17485 [Phycisphaerae bacterium]|nr:hypothetical protein [Phycisphaerae bacterium]
MNNSCPILLASFLTENPMLALGVVLAAGALLLLATRRNIRRREQQACGRSASASARSSLPAAGRSQRQLQESMEKLLLELEQLSREINSQVDTRLRALNLLIREADEKIRQLQRMQGLPETDGAAAPPEPRREPHPEVTSERYARVYQLAERGLTVVEIAHELEMLTGEVELILALRRTGAGAAGDRA